MQKRPNEGFGPSDIDSAEKPDNRRGPKGPRVSIPVTAAGDLDLKNIGETSRERLRAALQANPDAFADLGASTSAGIAAGQGEGPVTADHINILLTIWEHGERVAIPMYIHTQDKAVTADSQLAGIAFKFSVEDRAHLAPLGAKWLNQVLPEWMLKWLAKGGPGAEFLIGIGIATYMQTQAYLELWKAKHGAIVEGEIAQPVNGQERVSA